MPRFVERHWDQVLIIQGTVPAGTSVRQIPLTVDPSAPFVLRSIGAYQQGTSSPATALVDGTIRWYDYKRANFQSESVGMTAAAASLLADMPIGGKGNLFSPVWRHSIYPANGTIITDLFNDSGDDWLNPTIIFRGVQLYVPGAAYAPTYPDCSQSQPFTYPLTVTIPDATPLYRLKIQNQDDAAFCVRGLMATPDPSSAAGGWKNLFVRLYDRDLRYYASDMIHIDWLFSQDQAERPGIVYPEIFLPQNENLYFDLQCTDAAGSLTLDLAFDGAKIYPMDLDQPNPWEAQLGAGI